MSAGELLRKPIHDNGHAAKKQKLDSWKEIARYLGREVRTVQRWEKTQSLPVRRLHHQTRGSVYAFAADLDAWLASRQLSSPAEEVDSTSAYDRNRAACVAVIVVAALIVATATRMFLERRGRVTTVEALSKTDQQAAAAYLRGLYFLSLQTGEGFSKSIPQFEESARREPRFAPAYARLAEVHTFGSFGNDREKELMAARELSDKASRLDSSAAEVHEALGLLSAYGDWNWSHAEAEYKTALNLDPELVTAHSNYAQLAAILGRNDLAVTEARHAWQLQPLSPTLGANLAWYFYWVRRFDDAIATSRQVLQSQPGFPSAQACIVRSLITQGKFAEARIELIGEMNLDQKNAHTIGLDSGSAVQAIRNFYLWKLGKLKELERAGDFPSFDLALAYAALGDKDAMLDCLDKAYAKKQFIAMLINAEPFFDAYRSDSRFIELTHKVGLPAVPPKPNVVAGAQTLIP